MKAFMTALLSFIIAVVIRFGFSFISWSEASTVAFLTQYWLWILGAVGSFLLLLLWGLPKLQVDPSVFTNPKERFTHENEARKTLAQIIGGLVILIGLYFTWQTLNLNREGQITDRFTRAIDQLGAIDEHGKKKLEIRLGGIYALERIARDSKKDHWQIMEILTAYVRENAPWKEQQQFGSPKISTPSPKEDQVSKLAADIQAILTVLGRRTQTYGKGESQPLNLSGVDIRGAILEGANFQEAFLSETNLQGAFLASANLQGASLFETNLQGARGLDIEQLSKVKTLFGAKLDSSVMEQIQKAYPHLLEFPRP